MSHTLGLHLGVCLCAFAGYSYYPNNGTCHVHPAHIHDGTSHPATKPPVSGQHRHSQYQQTHKHNQLSPVTNEIYKCNYLREILNTQSQISFSSLSSLQYIPANTTMQGTYIPQYTPVPPSSVPVEV